LALGFDRDRVAAIELTQGADPKEPTPKELIPKEPAPPHPVPNDEQGPH
jgi:hypothetical protein